MTQHSERRVLCAVSSMGLGHVQRSLPLMRALVARGDELTLVSHGRALEVLRVELEDARGVRFLDLPDYPPLQRGRGLAHYIHFFPDLLGIEWGILRERRFLARLQNENAFAIVVTDGRLGFHHPEVPSLLLSHQLRFFLPPLLQPFQALSDARQRVLLRSYTRVIVPDLPDSSASVARPLAHNAVAEAVAPLYIGPLSTLDGHGSADDEAPSPSGIPAPEVVFVMGGFIEAERQRFVEEVLRIVAGGWVNGTRPRVALLLGGGSWGRPELPPEVDVHRLLVGADRRRLLRGARMWVGRTGQTTLMDLWATRSRGVLVPTPGMTEHVRLAEMVREWGHRPEPGRDAELAAPFLEALAGSVYFDGRKLPAPLLAWSTRDSVRAFLSEVDRVLGDQ